MIFGIKEKSIILNEGHHRWHFELKHSSLDIFFFYMLRKTGFAVQGHIYCMCVMQNTNMSITEEKQLVVGQTHTR